MCSQPVVGAGWNDHFWHLDPAGGQPAPMRHGSRYQLAFRLKPRPQVASRHYRTGLDARQQATLVLRDAHGGLFSGFGWEW